MLATIHPHKGYLNTKFHIHLKGNKPLSYEIFTKSSVPELYTNGVVRPSIPKYITINLPGEYEVHFNDGSVVDLVVEDAYKFGGSAFKKAFVFDQCTWAFIVMHDRTYFHNRETKEEYVELVSPDDIIEISKEFVLFKFSQQDELTLYSLSKQQPVREFSDILKHTGHYIVYEEEISDDERSFYLNIYSLAKDKCILRHKVDKYDIYGNNLYLFYDQSVKHILLNQELDSRVILVDCEGIPVKVIDPYIAITYIKQGANRYIYVYSLPDETIIKKIPVEGYLCSVNGDKLIDLRQRINAISHFNISASEFPEVSINVQYDEYIFYNCGWEIFYEIKSLRISKDANRKSDQEEIRKFRTCGLCPDTNSDLFTINPDHTIESIYRHNNTLLVTSDSLYILYTNIGIHKGIHPELHDFSQFEKLGTFKNTETSEESFLEKELLSDCARYIHYESIGATSLHEMGFSYFSPKDQYAIEIDKDRLYLIKRLSENTIIRERILQSLFDYSVFYNVLLSEDGSKVMHRDNKKTVVIDLESGNKQLFNNLSYVQHINGIRPSFEVDKKRQVVLINPVTGLPIPSTLLSSHSFISPDGSMYADTNLDAYTEYYNILEKRIISKSEYNSILKNYSYPFCSYEKDPRGHRVVKKLREQIVKKHLSWFKTHVRKVNRRSDIEWIEFFVDEKKFLGNDYFLSFIVEKRGVAVIKRTKNDTEIARINLGRPLWFLNYVSFSYDGRYVAIAGRYPNKTIDQDGKSLGGLFLCYDLINRETILQETDTNAVWTTAFTKQGLLAAYSSNPITFITTPTKGELIKLIQYSFLAFSPDGRYLALSKKGYISKDSGKNNWGHQKSTEVFICDVDDPENIICSFNDLSDNGVATLGKRKENVASVAFSNNNRLLLMVGEDGVMIIRNLHLN